MSGSKPEKPAPAKKAQDAPADDQPATGKGGVYTVLSRIKRDGKVYDPADPKGRGKTITLSDDDAEPLLTAGAIERPTK